MLEELKLQSLQEEGFVRHPCIPYVLFHTGDGFCLKCSHLNPNGMNVGAMRQHLRSKAHNVDPETGNPLNKKGLLQIIKELKNQEEEKSKREEFDCYCHEVKKIFEFKDPMQGIIVANNKLEGKERDSIVNYLNFLYSKEIEQAEYEKKEAEYEKAVASLTHA